MVPQPQIRTAEGKEMLLDDVLGPGFAVLVGAARAAQAAPLLQGKPWSDLRARVVVLGDKAPDGAVAVQPLSPVLDAYADQVLLIRPDRYVAASVKVDELEKGGEAIRKLIAETFGVN
jgi:3-(3-hydroxy-phenyl)propionate hydroxylase